MYSLAEFNDPTTAQEFVALTPLPDPSDSAPQEATQIFLIAHLILGYFAFPIVSNIASQTGPAKTLVAYAELLYWANRRDLSFSQKQTHMNIGWAVLLDAESTSSVDAFNLALWSIHLSFKEFAHGEKIETSLGHDSEHELKVCRLAMRNPESQQGYFNWTNTAELITYAIGTIGDLGNASDLTVLRPFCDSPTYGSIAISAIQKIEARLH
jgi:hypothetical protein